MTFPCHSQTTSVKIRQTGLLVEHRCLIWGIKLIDHENLVVGVCLLPMDLHHKIPNSPKTRRGTKKIRQMLNFSTLLLAHSSC